MRTGDPPPHHICTTESRGRPPPRPPPPPPSLPPTPATPPPSMVQSATTTSRRPHTTTMMMRSETIPRLAMLHLVDHRGRRGCLGLRGKDSARPNYLSLPRRWSIARTGTRSSGTGGSRAGPPAWRARQDLTGRITRTCGPSRGGAPSLVECTPTPSPRPPQLALVLGNG